MNVLSIIFRCFTGIISYTCKKQAKDYVFQVNGASIDNTNV